MTLASVKLRVGRFWYQEGGISALEFAIGAPVLILLLLVGVDTARFVFATLRVDDVAAAIGQMISQNQTGSIVYRDLQFYHDSAMVIFPELLTDAKQQGVSWTKDISISMSDINFVASPAGCASNCAYLPQMVWTGGANPRSCTAPMIPVSDASSPSPSTLPADLFRSGSLVVVDVQFRFHPLVAPSFMSALTIARSYYGTPRFVPLIKYQTISGDNGIASPCPGFS